MSKTYHDGARVERQAVLRKLRLLARDAFGIRQKTLREIIAWVISRKDRYRRRKGGL